MNQHTQPQEQKGNDLYTLFVNLVRSAFRFWWLLALLTVLFGAISFGHTLHAYSPRYRSESTFTVTTGSTGSVLDTTYNFYYDSTSAQQLGRTFPHILSSELLTDAIKRDLDTNVIAGSINAQTLENSNMVTMSVEGSDPAEVKRILESAIRVYPEVAQFVIGKIRFNIIDPPNLPTEPYNTPCYVRAVWKGAVIGLVLWLLFIYAYAFFRRTIHDETEIQKSLNVPCLVSLPLDIRKERKKNKDRLICIDDKTISPWFEESVKALWQRLENAMSKSQKKVLLVTSTAEGEGKTTVAFNLACRIAQNDKRVLLVDADCRLQLLGKRLGFPDQNLGKALRCIREPEQLLRYDPNRKLLFLGGSVGMKNASRFLSVNLKAIVSSVSDAVDYIIIDAPAAGVVEDAFLIREYVDAVLYVVRQDHTPKQQVIDTIADFDSEEIPVIGYVFNGVTGILGEYGYGKYGYGKYGYGKYGYGKYGYGKYGYGKYGYGKSEEAKQQKSNIRIKP